MILVSLLYLAEMYYYLEYNYTYADTVSWGVEINQLISPEKQKLLVSVIALLLMFLLWLPFYYLLNRMDLSPFAKGPILFSSFYLAITLFTAFLEPIMIKIIDGRATHTDIQQYNCAAEITDTGIKFKDRAKETQYDWEAFHSVHDTEKSIIFIGDTLHAVIPAKCFSHFLEKDAFVRECKKYMPAYRSDGPEAFD